VRILEDMSLALLDFSGRTIAAVTPGRPIVVGRAVECDVTLTDATISRRHAEVRAEEGGLVVRDLGSRNGTYRNGQRVEVARVRAGDTITFGALTLRVADWGAPALEAPRAPATRAPESAPAPRAEPRAAPADDAAAWYASAMARQASVPGAPAPRPAIPAAAEALVAEPPVLATNGAVPPAPPLEPPIAPPVAPPVAPPAPAEPEPIVDEPPEAVGESPSAEQELPIVAERGEATPAAELAARKLALLLDVAKGLGRAGEVEPLLERVVGYAFETLDADRAAILLARDGDDAGSLSTAVARDRWGGDLTAGTGATRDVPRSIVRAALERRAALLSVNAAADPRFGGQSVLHQRVRSAMCAPLLGSDAAPLGVLYVDSAAPDRTFGEEDLDFLSAFAGIAAAALETARLGERLRREAVSRGNFERYFAPPVAARIARSSEFARPGGERRPVTVLFGDVRGFTKLAASAAPDAVAATISAFLSAMVECVFHHGGTLDKFIGDAVMAQWGAPEAEPDDADRAMRAALDMLDALDVLNARRHEEGHAPLAMGIGLSHGEVFAGNIGSERRLEFTVLGDAVNQASRLCDAAGPDEILLTDALRRVLREPPPMRLLPAADAPRTAGAPQAVYAVVRRVG